MSGDAREFYVWLWAIIWRWDVIEWDMDEVICVDLSSAIIVHFAWNLWTLHEVIVRATRQLSSVRRVVVVTFGALVQVLATVSEIRHGVGMSRRTDTNGWIYKHKT